MPDTPIAPPSLYQTQIRIQRKNQPNSAPLYVQLHDQYQRQRAVLLHSRKRAISEPTPPSPPSPLELSSPPSRIKYVRREKTRARKEISKSYGRIPQHDGPISLPSSREHSPENPPTQKLSAYFDSDSESIPWDYTEVFNLTNDPIITGSVDYLSSPVQKTEFDNFHLQLDGIHFDENDDLWEPLENISQPFLLRRGDADL